MSISSPSSAASSSSHAASSSNASAVAQTGTTAASSLDLDFNDFLTMLMTQLQNQDPTAPMDSSQFTTELVQFSSVEQQISTNTNLTQLISLNQASQVEQSSAMLGKSAVVTSPQLSLQNGTASISFNTSNAQPVAVSVYNAAGAQIQTDSFTSTAGANTWQWNGQNANGVKQADGAYTVTVTAVGTTGSTATVPFTVTGTVTAVQNNSGTVDIQMGGLTLPFNDVESVGSGS